jgi:hypothetical protein
VNADNRPEPADQQARWRGVGRAAQLLWMASTGDTVAATDLYDSEFRLGQVFELVNGLMSIAADLGLAAIEYAAHPAAIEGITYYGLLDLAAERADMAISASSEIDQLTEGPNEND